MHIIEQTFIRTEYDKFILHEFEGLPADREQPLRGLIQKHGARNERDQHYRRLAALRSAANKIGVNDYYAQVYGIMGVRRYVTSGHTVYRMPVKSFVLNDVWGHYTNCYLIVGRELTLIDCAMSSSEPYFEECFRVVREFYGEHVSLEDVQNVIITHAHIDHFGGLSFLYEKCNARLYVHQDDVKTIEQHHEISVKTEETISRFLSYTGLPEDELLELKELYKTGKKAGPGWEVSNPVHDGDLIIDDYEVIHVPGHCPGQINIIVGDLIFLGDQILMDISPHQFPRFYRKGMGLTYYIPSLLKVCSRLQQVRLGLAAHNEEVRDVRARALEIVSEHHERLADLLALLDRPKSVYELTTQYYTEVHVRSLVGYDRILALEEIEAHMEYLDSYMGFVEAVPEECDGRTTYLYRRR